MSKYTIYMMVISDMEKNKIGKGDKRHSFVCLPTLNNNSNIIIVIMRIVLTTESL